VKRRIKWRPVLIVVGAALAIYLIVGVILAGKNTPPLPSAQNGITLLGGRVRGNRITTKSWSFDYTSAQLSADGATGTIEGVRDGIVYKKSKPYLRITAQRISIDTLSLNFTAIGKVTVELIGDPLKRSFDTDLVVWTNATKLLKMEHTSYLHAGGQTMAFNSITVNFATDKIHFSGIDGSTEIPK